jgi:hypothetical protein
MIADFSSGFIHNIIQRFLISRQYIYSIQKTFGLS